MTPYYEHAGIVIFHGDCREILPGLRAEAVVTDPPYGLGDRWTGGTWFTRNAWNAQDLRRWDAAAPHDVIESLLQLDVETVLWGGNNFRVPPSRCWLAWVKPNAVPTMASMELAWTSLDRPALTFTRPCGGWPREHPTEKPVDLMRWCVGLVEGSILDPFMGSGTTLVAAKNLGRQAIGIEIEERYCEIAAQRLEQEVLPLHTEPTPEPIQAEL